MAEQQRSGVNVGLYMFCIYFGDEWLFAQTGFELIHPQGRWAQHFSTVLDIGL
jgi:hypothetical protein